MLTAARPQGLVFAPEQKVSQKLLPAKYSVLHVVRLHTALAITRLIAAVLIWPAEKST